ncbi:MAG: 7TM diverse intracellular signaling domain-containing protein, partial [Bacteroidota bacterium]
MNKEIILYGLIMYLCSLHTLVAQERLIIDDQTETIDIGKYFQIYKDTSNKLSLDEIILPENRDLFTPANTDSPSFGFSKHNFWVKLAITNEGKETRERFIAFSYPLLDIIECYYFDEVEGWQQYRIGDKIPFSERLIAYHEIIIPIQPEAGKTVTYYFKISTDSSVQLPATLQTSAGMQTYIATKEVLFGIFYGVVLVMLVYNLVLYFAIRYISYLYYCCYALTYCISQGALAGHPLHFLWGDAIWWANIVIPFTLCLAIMSATLFTTRFLDTKKYTPRFHQFFTILIILYAIGALAGLVAPYNVGIKIGAISVIVGSLFIFAAGVTIWVMGNKTARFYVIAWGIYLAALVIVPSIALGIIPNSAFFRYSTEISATVQMVMLSFALTQQINTIRKDRQKAKNLALKAAQENERIIKEQNEMLEKKVRVRTQALQQKQEEVTVQNEELHQ